MSGGIKAQSRASHKILDKETRIPEMRGTCGGCRHCLKNDVCDGDCLCSAKHIEVSRDDDIRFYGENPESPCGSYAPKK